MRGDRPDSCIARREAPEKSEPRFTRPGAHGETTGPRVRAREDAGGEVPPREFVCHARQASGRATAVGAGASADPRPGASHELPRRTCAAVKGCQGERAGRASAGRRGRAFRSPPHEMARRTCARRGRQGEGPGAQARVGAAPWPGRAGMIRLQGQAIRRGAPPGRGAGARARAGDAFPGRVRMSWPEGHAMIPREDTRAGRRESDVPWGYPVSKDRRFGEGAPPGRGAGARARAGGRVPGPRPHELARRTATIPRGDAGRAGEDQMSPGTCMGMAGGPRCVAITRPTCRGGSRRPSAARGAGGGRPAGRGRGRPGAGRRPRRRWRWWPRRRRSRGRSGRAGGSRTGG
ncbi:hypothetical protein SAMN02745121_06747 [Nannocystis exedens]|uniref:Uncharacterized protein n=1 Tax=Nannocystis exedens TaxID=54 RepID=A0A1I2FPD4_9BACT|nr:hypothetical protein NAEX_07585 [Nannocystis exedens]SFF06607.1 hypothetical protein SAMN02745121_06747 [Nannocystis exedens]